MFDLHFYLCIIYAAENAKLHKSFGEKLFFLGNLLCEVVKMGVFFLQEILLVEENFVTRTRVCARFVTKCFLFTRNFSC